ncbi:uncharacterized protein [Nicotiana sylvestris]|uniref:Uncharacterized protein LOC104216966 n=1 Tax=Nicotiana sylvestris TaxID=4096 RepID=A0A1U7VU19_NICSY|nr:PREDICTED: uncharacterized protein LOC104216966 [Nicotiana sylvestris]
MGTTSDLQPARLEENTTPEGEKIQIEEGILNNPNYATAVKTPTMESTSSNRHGNPDVKARYSTHNGMPAIIFKASYYYGVMAEECRLTIVGKFLRTRPQIEKIRSKFAEKITVKGNVKIGVYDYGTVFLDFSNEDDLKSVWYRRSIEIEVQVMWLEQWTPDFKPEEDSPVVPVWVLLPDLPFHCHTWYYIKQILSPIGIPLTMDMATNNKTRPSMAKVRIEVDLTKPKLNSVWVGQEYETSPLKGFTQKLEYENVPKYYRHCRLLGHSLVQCRKAEKKVEEEGINKGKSMIGAAVESMGVQQEKEEKENNETQKQGTTEESTHIDNNTMKPPTDASQNKGNKAHDKLEIMQGHGNQMKDKTIAEWLIKKLGIKRRRKRRTVKRKCQKRRAKFCSNLFNFKETMATIK